MSFITRICCIGAGYVGSTTLAVLASQCPDVCVTLVETEFLSPDRIKAWNSPNPPVYEPGLEDILQKCRGKNLFFSAECEKAVREADIIFISVHTPTKKHGMGAGMAPDLDCIERCARFLCNTITSGHKIVVELSTVPVKCAEAIQKVLDAAGKPEVRYDVLSNPSFRSAATAIDDLLRPDRVLIGCHKNTVNGLEAAQTLANIYSRWVPKEKIITTDLWSSELTKLVNNAMLAQRLSSINAISAVCDATGADVDEVAYAIGRDTRLGPGFFKVSPGFGGVALQKDILNLVYLSYSLRLKEVGDYWMKVIEMNNYQKKRFAAAIVHSMFDTVANKRLAIFGFAFKKGTNDTRETCAISICTALLDEGAQLYIYDPKVPAMQIREDLARAAQDNKRLLDSLNTNLHIVAKPMEASDSAHALVFLTDWDEFLGYDYALLYSRMNKPAFLFDGRAFLPHSKLREIGFLVTAIGKPDPAQHTTM